MAADPVVVLVGTLDTKGHELEELIKMISGLHDEGTALLASSTKLGVATALAERQLGMVGGQIAAETTARELEDDPDAQRRYLGVEPIATEE